MLRSTTTSINKMANCRSNYWWIVLLLVTIFLITFSKGESVSLTVEGGVSLVGPQCPGTVRLFCEGVQLTSLRWRYNGNVNIKSYFPNNSSTIQPTELAFFVLQLMTVEQNPNSLNFGNFSSSLTVNSSQLLTNNVAEISCGDPGVSQVEPVNVSIIEPSIPNDPSITMVTAAYQSGELNSVKVTWEKSNNFCPSFGLPFVYEVNLTTYGSVLVNHSSCGKALCVASFDNFTGEMKEYTISIKANNVLGSSDLVQYLFPIAHQIQQYFSFDVFLKDRQLFGECTTARGFVGSVKNCTVQYTTDSMYRDLSSETIGSLNTEFPIREDPALETTYYFQFSVLVNDTLQITERITFKYSVQAGIPSYGIALIVIVVIVCVIVLVVAFIITAIVAFNKLKLAKEKTPVTMEGDGESSEESLEEEPKVLTISVESYKREKKVFGEGIFKNTTNYTDYKIVVKFGEKTIAARKSDTQFEEMYNKVKEEETYRDKARELDLPPKQYKRDFFDAEKFDDNYLENRRQELHYFINFLMKFPKILEFTPVQEFLNLDDTLMMELKENNITELSDDQQACSVEETTSSMDNHLFALDLFKDNYY